MWRELYRLVPDLAKVVTSVHCHEDLGLAVADSVGTEKTSFPKPPGVASGEETSTCAEAGNVETSTKPPAAASAISARPGARVLRDMMDRKDMWDLSPRE